MFYGHRLFGYVAGISEIILSKLPMAIIFLEVLNMGDKSLKNKAKKKNTATKKDPNIPASTETPRKHY